MPHAHSDRICPLCGRWPAAPLHRDTARDYFCCTNCGLIFVPPRSRPDPAAEKARYDLHENHPHDAGYRRFLAPLAEAVIQATTADARGLDFGCGPGPALAAMLRDSGRTVFLYDPFYAPDETVWTRTYDFIVASEVFEHLHHPRTELDRLFRALRPGGLLAVMTGFAPPSQAEFAAWHYPGDPTHVCFYSPCVFEYIALAWHAAPTFPAPNVALLQRRAS